MNPSIIVFHFVVYQTWIACSNFVDWTCNVCVCCGDYRNRECALSIFHAILKWTNLNSGNLLSIFAGYAPTIRSRFTIARRKRGRACVQRWKHSAHTRTHTRMCRTYNNDKPVFAYSLRVSPRRYIFYINITHSMPVDAPNHNWME